MFYEFTQNNSGGDFVVDDRVCHRLFIEADDHESAVRIAVDLGVYFNGVEDDIDCTCCGDRWSKYDDRPVEFPMTYEQFRGGSLTFGSVSAYAQYLADKHGWTFPDCRIYFKSGKVEEIFKRGRDHATIS